MAPPSSIGIPPPVQSTAFSAASSFAPTPPIQSLPQQQQQQQQPAILPSTNMPPSAPTTSQSLAYQPPPLTGPRPAFMTGPPMPPPQQQQIQSQSIQPQHSRPISAASHTPPPVNRQYRIFNGYFRENMHPLAHSKRIWVVLFLLNKSDLEVDIIFCQHNYALNEILFVS